jgi:hypothetical protein
MVNTQTGIKQYFSGAAQIPSDGTIPQSSEGSEVMTLAVTPTSSTNKLKIEVVTHFSILGANAVTALLKDSDTDAIAIGYSSQAAGTAVQHSFTYYMTAGTTSEITFKVNVGGDSTDTTFNGLYSNTAKYGNKLASSITITEIQV